MAFQLWEICLGAFGTAWLGMQIYRAAFAPLSKLPGPWYSLFSDIFLMYKEFSAQRRVYIHELHKRFGPVVRLGPNEVSFTSPEALKEIYQSSGSGYDKTEFYDLFIQYKTRTTFSTLQKQEHDQMKRHIAGSYANTSIMHPEVLDGIHERTDSGDHSLVYSLKNGNGAFRPIQVAAECMNHLAAGIDTTGDALCFLMYQLSLPESYPVQEKLIAEISSNRDKALNDLPYLEAVIKEGLRCFPPIPMSQPRYVPSAGRMIDGYFIPGRTIVSCQAWSVHRLNPDIFDRGDRFIPERWLDSKAIPMMNKLFFSFGAGGRSCTGRHLAIVEMKCLLRELYSRYRTRIAPEMRASMELYDQAISTRPIDQTCLLTLESV
ncbi:hypothetical protein B7463_g9409, partial [Scytalidium lignicola]